MLKKFYTEVTLIQIFGGGGEWETFYLLKTLPSLGGLPLTFLFIDLVFLLFLDLSTKSLFLTFVTFGIVPKLPTYTAFYSR